MFEWIDLFSSLSRKDLQTLELFCQERMFNNWEVLFELWEESTSMYIVVSWTLQAYIGDKILWNITSWEFVWEMSIFDEPKLRSASVRAIENTRVITLLSFSLNQLWKNNPEIISKIKDVINQRKKQNKN